MRDAVLLLVAMAIGIAGYALWYWVEVHQFCLAMWFGTAPPVIIGLIAWTAYKLLKRSSWLAAWQQE